MNIQQQEQFYQMMGRLRGSRAASTNARVTEMVNGLLVSKPVATKEPEIIDLQEYAKQIKSNAASVPGINKLKVIQKRILTDNFELLLVDSVDTIIKMQNTDNKKSTAYTLLRVHLLGNINKMYEVIQD